MHTVAYSSCEQCHLLLLRGEKKTQPVRMHEIQLCSGCLWGMGDDLAFHMIYIYIYFFFHVRAAVSSFPPGVAAEHSSLRASPCFTQKCPSPRAIWKIGLCVLIYLDLVTERLLWKDSGKFQRAFPEGTVPALISLLMLSSSGFLKGEICP